MMIDQGRRTGCEANLQALRAFWDECVAADGLATRRRVTPFTLRRWLGHLCVYELLPGDSDFRIKLDGTAVVALTGEDWTGRQVSAVDARYDTTLLADCLDVCLTARPVLSRSALLFQKTWVTYHRLLLPVSARGDRYDQVFNAIYAADS